MSEKSQTGARTTELATQIKKKPYSKPEFRHERAFETSALACGKVLMGPTCAMHKKSS